MVLSHIALWFMILVWLIPSIIIETCCNKGLASKPKEKDFAAKPMFFPIGLVSHRNLVVSKTNNDDRCYNQQLIINSLIPSISLIIINNYIITIIINNGTIPSYPGSIPLG